MLALNIDFNAYVHSSLLAGRKKQYRKQQEGNLLRMLNDQVFHHRSKLEAHSIEAHGLDLKMEQVKLKNGLDLHLPSPRCALNAI